MACTTPEDVQVICPDYRETPRRLGTGGGWRRTCVWRERRWPNFIIWRWAGPGRVGWTHCPRKESPRLLLPRRRRRPLPSMSPHPVDVLKGPAAPLAVPARSRLLAVQRNAEAKSRPAGVPRRAPVNLPNEPREPSGAAGALPARAPGNPPVHAAGNPQAARVPVVLPLGSGPRRAAAGAVNPVAPAPRRS
jgi:hypothetical protein